MFFLKLQISNSFKQISSYYSGKISGFSRVCHMKKRSKCFGIFVKLTLFITLIILINSFLVSAETFDYTALHSTPTAIPATMLTCNFPGGCEFGTNCDAEYFTDNPTALKICQMKGYDTLVSYIVDPDDFSSCFNNYYKRWNGAAWVDVCSCIDNENRGIKSVTCSRSCDTCPSLGKTCGTWPDGCGGTLNCGPIPLSCSSLGKTCGTWADGCQGILTCGGACPDVCTSGNVALGKSVTTNPVGEGSPSLITDGNSALGSGFWWNPVVETSSATIDLVGTFDISKYSITCAFERGNYGTIYFQNSLGQNISSSKYSCANNIMTVGNSFSSPIIGVNKIFLVMNGWLGSPEILYEVQVFKSCNLELVSSYAQPIALLGSEYTVKCNFGVAGLSCIQIPNLDCSPPSWVGADAIFSCTATPLSPPLKSNFCNLVDNAGIPGCVAQTNTIDSTNVVGCISPDASTCSQTIGQCEQYTCIGNVCGKENKIDNTPCNDGSDCTENDKCTSGSCGGTPPAQTPLGCSCSSPSTCPQSSGPCQYATCIGNVCGLSYNISSTVCRASAGTCDKTDYCSGSSPDCINLFNSTIDVCQVKVGCNNETNCTGYNATCPTQGVITNCNNVFSDDCCPTSPISCTWTGGSYPDNDCLRCNFPSDCNDNKPCTDDNCNLITHTCINTPKPCGGTAEDGGCCSSGCIYATDKDCTAECTLTSQCTPPSSSDFCKEAVCDVGICKIINKPDTITTCPDDPCYTGKECTNGVCSITIRSEPKSDSQGNLPAFCGEGPKLEFFNLLNVIEVIVIIGIAYFVYMLYKRKYKNKRKHENKNIKSSLKRKR